MSDLSLPELVSRLTHSLSRTRPVDDAGVIFGPGEQAVAMAQRRRVERQGAIAEGGGTGLKRAAVLIPLVAHAKGATVLLTQRTSHLAAHAGQISFPGGRLEPQDRDARAAALRETEEEIGLRDGQISLLGEMEEYGTISGFRVTPVVGLVTPPFTLRPDPHEVADIFEVPLAYILDPANRRHAVEKRDGIERDIYEICFGTYRIWGFTARLLVRLVDVIEGAGDSEGSSRAPIGTNAAVGKG